MEEQQEEYPQDYIEEQPEGNQGAVAPIMDMRERTNVLLFQLETEDTVTSLEHKFRCERQHPENPMLWVRPIGVDAMMNETGISEISALVRGHLDKNLILSNLTDTEINRICLECCQDVIDLLALKFEKFGMQKSSLSIVVDLMDHTIFGVLKRAKSGLGFKSINHQHRSIEQYTYAHQTPQSQQRKWWNLGLF